MTEDNNSTGKKSTKKASDTIRYYKSIEELSKYSKGASQALIQLDKQNSALRELLKPNSVSAALMALQGNAASEILKNHTNVIDIIRASNPVFNTASELMKMYNKSVLDYIRPMKDATSLLELHQSKIQDTLKTYRAAQLRVTEFSKVYNALASTYSSNQISSQFLGAGVPELFSARIADQIAQTLSSFPTLREAGVPTTPNGASFLFDGASVLEQHIEATDYSDEAASNFIHSILEWFAVSYEKASSQLERTYLANILAMLMLAWALYTTHIQSEQYKEFEQNLSTEFEELKDTIAHKGDAESNQRPNAVVIRNAHIRKGPSTNYDSKKILRAGDLCELIEARDGWLHITCYDALSGHVDTGWVYAKLIRVLPLD